MYSEKISPTPFWAWVAVSMTAPLTQLTAGESWLFLLMEAVVCGAACWAASTVSGRREPGKALCAVELLWLTAALGWLALRSAGAWPEGKAFPSVPLMMLLLAAASAWNGSEKASRVAGVLFFLVALLYSIILAAGIKELRPGWMGPQWKCGRPESVFVLLLPGAAVMLPRKKGGGAAWWLGGCMLFAAVVCLWTTGVLSAPVAAETAHPFYEAGKGSSLFGVAERFEAFISVALTLGWFCLFSLLLSLAGRLGGCLHPGLAGPAVIASAAVAAGIVLIRPAFTCFSLAAGAVLFWVLLPVLDVFRPGQKKSKKSENNA